MRSIPTAHPIDDVIANAAALAREFRNHGYPVVLVTVAGSAPGRTDHKQTMPEGFTPPPGWMDLVGDLDAQPDDHTITKQRWGAFHDTSLDQHLRDLGATQVVLAGVATSIGVESTARAAFEHSYHRVLATDAMTDASPEAHINSVERIFPRLGEVTTTAEILNALDQNREQPTPDPTAA